MCTSSVRLFILVFEIDHNRQSKAAGSIYSRPPPLSQSRLLSRHPSIHAPLNCITHLFGKPIIDLLWSNVSNSCRLVLIAPAILRSALATRSFVLLPSPPI